MIAMTKATLTEDTTPSVDEARKVMDLFRSWRWTLVSKNRRMRSRAGTNQDEPALFSAPSAWVNSPWVKDLMNVGC